MKPRMRKLFIAAGVEIVVVAAIFVAFAALGNEGRTVRARRLLTFFMIAESLAASFAPLFGAGRAAK